jgi:catechol 2,3-dioxygenase-like lactoylglutathione lyase family enzyme
MAVLNHHIVRARHKEEAARFFAEVLGLEWPTKLGEFAVVRVSPDTTLDFVDAGDDFDRQHYAFLVTEAEFDEIFARLRGRNAPYWADPRRREADNINVWDDGRGVYFDDPNGHLLEIITRPYGSGGTSARHPHPLVNPPVERPEG